MTLFGDALPVQSSQGIFFQANRPNSAIGPASQQARPAAIVNEIATILAPSQPRASLLGESNGSASTKQWDFAQPITKAKRPFKADPDDLDEFDDLDDFAWDDCTAQQQEDFVRAPDPLQAELECLKQMKVKIDRIAARTWIYPTNKERRDYQYNIVQRALFNNVLVALPTGLGKTFIAAVVILNYYRWFPEGKIIFVAPTKPLVAQQQIACHGICGLPWNEAIEMTGETKASLRAEEWKAKRIFYMTPQTFENDLCSTAISADDVVCVVVDEAHRATGNYAYGKVIRHMMQRNPFFRVLALTATPGSNSEKVQEVVDSLHINLIEIRQEDALDIRKYVHAKEEHPIVIPLSGLVADLRRLMVQLMQPTVNVLAGAGLLNVKDPASIAPFAVQLINRDPRKRAIVATRKLYPLVSEVGKLARAMEYLTKYSVKMFASKMLEMEVGTNAQGGKSSTRKQQSKYQSNTIVREMRKRIEECQDHEGLVPHPKMDYLRDVVASHFASVTTDDGKMLQETRIMVFCSFRECVTEIVDILNRVPSVKATQFVGQAADNKGNRGMRQKQQELVINDFKKGEYNVLVATSIGEEGLDIGEVDLIVCYEAVKNAVRMLQRVGRTGRKRQGRIVVLMSEGPEEKNWQQSKDQYKTIQHDIIKGVNLSLYDDVDRLVPPDITSEVRFEDVDQPPFEPSMIRDAAKKKRGEKRKRNSDPLRNVPQGALTGFITVSRMRKGGAIATKKGKSRQPDPSSREGDEDESEMQDLSSRSRLDSSLLPVLDSLSEGGTDSDLDRDLEVPLFMRPSRRPNGESLQDRGSDESNEAIVVEESATSLSDRTEPVEACEGDQQSNEHSGRLSAHRLADDHDDSSPIIARQRKRTFKRAQAPPSSDTPLAGIVQLSSKTEGAKSKAKLVKPMRKKRIGGSPTSRKLFYCEADRSTDEEVHGERDENDERDDQFVEDSSDREHVGDFAPTQAPKGYRQQAVYMQSLLSQNDIAPFRDRGEGSSNGHNGAARRLPAQIDIRSTPGGRAYSSGNEYEKDSFVCSDEELAFETDSETLSE
jgi:ATP-dependent DNA helicase MPH1